MTDVFRPRSQPALTLYEAFQAEAAHRKGREWPEWNHAEVNAVWRAARDYAQQRGLRVPLLEDVARAERYASGSIDYGATWAYRVAEMMRAAPNTGAKAPPDETPD